MSSGVGDQLRLLNQPAQLQRLAMFPIYRLHRCVQADLHLYYSNMPEDRFSHDVAHQQVRSFINILL